MSVRDLVYQVTGAREATGESQLPHQEVLHVMDHHLVTTVLASHGLGDWLSQVPLFFIFCSLLKQIVRTCLTSHHSIACFLLCLRDLLGLALLAWQQCMSVTVTGIPTPLTVLHPHLATSCVPLSLPLPLVTHCRVLAGAGSS